ncbi:hypothetical protein O181_089234 [Austropuccinia psidii MF-1]|uniref:Uncharacterized protein n=1 Tax=Austropuccinia psidii MF-1 TaxID=1389203 RepID=A0A9Q3IT91_9BASI|nr:hypothetical protein [Austropuccinia psidii MF-1]
MARQENIETSSTATRIIPSSTANSDYNSTVIITQNNQPEPISPELISLDISNTLQKANNLANRASYNPSRSSQKGYRHDYSRSQPVTEGQRLVNGSQTNKLCHSDADNTVLPSKRADNTTRSLSGHIKSPPEGLQQCSAAQRVPDSCKSVKQLHEFLPDCEKTPGPSKNLKVNQWMTSIDGKEKHDAFNSRTEKNNPPSPKQVPKTAPVARSSNSKVKKQPKAQNKGKGKSPATKPYSQGYRIPKIQQDAMENLFQMDRTMMEFQKKELARLKYQK